MSYFLGVDMGTTSVKTVAFNASGQVLAAFSSPLKMFHPSPGWSEQDPAEILDAVVSCINKMIAARGVPLLISFSTAMHSLIAVDDKGQPLTACIIWADNRATDIAEKLRATGSGEAFYRATGAPVHAMLPSCKIAWLRDHQPDIFRRTFMFIGIKEYILHHLTGEYVVDTSIASATGMLNIHQLQWDSQVLAWLGITSALLPALVSPLHIVIYRGGYHALNLPAGIAIVMGGSDGAMANLGTGAIGVHDMAISIGTSSAARRVVEGPATDPRMRTFCYHIKGNQYIVGGASNNGAVVLQWLRESLLQTGESYEELISLAGTVPPGCEGLVFMPYILGERAPVWNSRAKGIFYGLTIDHTKAHLVRAAMEGIICSVYSFGQLLLADGSVSSLHVTGGFAESALGLQMLADLFNREVLVTDSVEGSALGAVMLGMEATGMGQQVTHHTVASYKPDQANHKIYYALMERFERIYDGMKDEFFKT